MAFPAFERVSEVFLDTLGRIPDSAWNAPGLGDWSVRSLAGHTSRALATVRTALTSGESVADATDHVATAEAYYGAIAASAGPADAVLERGVQAGVDLADDPVERVTTLRREVLDLLAAVDADAPIRVRGLALPLGEYLRTREFELVVHTLDLGRATGVEVAFDRTDVVAALRLAAGLAAQGDAAGEALMLLTGRDGSDFSVV